MAKNQVVTRDQFEVFLANSEAFEILRSIPQSQLQPLFDVGKSVCQIVRPDRTDGSWGSGFHMGSGWIMTALNVVSNGETMGAELVSVKASFHFPNTPVIAAESRKCICSNFRGAPGIDPCGAIVKDLAIIYVPELRGTEYNGVTGILHPHEKPPQAGDRVYLVHFGQIDGGGDQTPQQFSVNGSVILEHEVNHPSGNRYSTHNTYFRPGSSGAPLLVFRENLKKFMVAGVHFNGPETDGKSTGYALWFTKKNWLQQTVQVAVGIADQIYLPWRV